MTQADRGFTLIEVLVALIIAALLLPALLLAFGSQADGIGYIRDKSIAQWVASNKLEEARLEARHSQKIFTGERSGISEMAQREWYWWLRSEATEVEDFYRVEVRVAAREEDADQPLYILVGFLAPVVAGTAAAGAVGGEAGTGPEEAGRRGTSAQGADDG